MFFRLFPVCAARFVATLRPLSSSASRIQEISWLSEFHSLSLSYRTIFPVVTNTFGSNMRISFSYSFWQAPLSRSRWSDAMTRGGNDNCDDSHTEHAVRGSRSSVRSRLALLAVRVPGSRSLRSLRTALARTARPSCDRARIHFSWFDSGGGVARDGRGLSDRSADRESLLLEPLSGLDGESQWTRQSERPDRLRSIPATRETTRPRPATPPDRTREGLRHQPGPRSRPVRPPGTPTRR